MAEAEIDHAAGHLVQVGELFLNDLYSDVTLMVEGQALKAHRAILAAKSEYFRTLLTSGMKESHSKEVELKETPIEAFRLLLRYIYTGHMSLADQDLEVVLDVLGLAHKYCFTELEEPVSKYLCSSLSVGRVIRIFETAALLEIKSLMESSNNFIDKHIEEVLDHPSYLKLPQHHVTDIISRDWLGVPEIKIFKAAQKWLESNTRTQEEEGAKTASSEVTTQVMSKVRLELIPVKDILSVVRPSGLVSQDTLLDTVESSLKMTNPPKSQRRENVVTEENGTKVLCGHNGTSLLNRKSSSYASHTNINAKCLPSLVAKGASSCKLCEHHTGTCTSGIVVMLGRPFIINHIAMKLWNEEVAYSYVIDVSADGKTWDRVIDYSSFQCRSLQSLFFQQRTVKFIRIVGTGKTSRDFSVVSLEAFYITTSVSSHDKTNILGPSWDVAMSACAIRKGTNHDGGMLSEAGWTSHPLDGAGDFEEGNDEIVVQLAHPCMLAQIRFELDDDVDNAVDAKYRYAYYVEVSIDNKNWERVWDRTAAISESGWQNITFSSRPVVFIRIKGIGSNRDDPRRFYINNLECPSSLPIRWTEPAL